jgi:hypothetical protein
MSEIRTSRELTPLQLRWATTPWSRIAGIAASAATFAVIGSLFALPSFNVPEENELQRVDGEFAQQTENGRRPYSFVTDSGQMMTFGCAPELQLIPCLEQNGIALQSLAGHKVTVGYFTAHPLWWKFTHASWPDIAATIDMDNRPVYTFAQSHVLLVAEERRSRGARLFPAMVLCGLGFINALTTCVALFGKLKYGTRVRTSI